MHSAPESSELVLASTFAGISSTLIGHPLDTVKTHLQTNASSRNSLSALAVAKRLRWGLFNGMGPPLVNSIVMNTVMFSIFDLSIQKSSNAFVAGLLSGFATAMVSTPTDRIKIHAQLKGKSSWEVVRQHLTTNGGKSVQLFPVLLRLYQGHVANLTREGIFTMVYLGLYHYILPRRDDGMDVNSRNPGLLRVALISSLTGALAWIVSYPFDTIKTLRQSEHTRNDIYGILKAQGPKPFYKGCLASTGRAMMVTSSRMIAYEWCLRMFRASSYHDVR